MKPKHPSLLSTDKTGQRPSSSKHLAVKPNQNFVVKKKKGNFNGESFKLRKQPRMLGNLNTEVYQCLEYLLEDEDIVLQNQVAENYIVIEPSESSDCIDGVKEAEDDASREHVQGEEETYDDKVDEEGRRKLKPAPKLKYSLDCDIKDKLGTNVKLVLDATHQLQVAAATHTVMDATPKVKLDVTSKLHMDVSPKSKIDVTPKLKEDLGLNVDVIPKPKIDITPKPKVDATRKPKADIHKSKGDATPKPKADVPKPKMDITPKPKMDITPKPKMDITPKPKMDITPKPKMDITPKPKMDITPKPKMDITPKPKMDGTSKPNVDATKLKIDAASKPKMNVASKPNVDDTPKLKVEVTPIPKVDVTPKLMMDVTPKPKLDATSKPNVVSTSKSKADVTPRFKGDANTALADSAKYKLDDTFTFKLKEYPKHRLNYQLATNLKVKESGRLVGKGSSAKVMKENKSLYEQLWDQATDTRLPSLLWSVHRELSGRFVTFVHLSENSTSSRMVADKTLVFEESCCPVVHLRGVKVNLTHIPEELESLEQVATILRRMDKLVLCEGMCISDKRYRFSDNCQVYFDRVKDGLVCQSCEQCQEEFENIKDSKRKTMGS